MEDIVSSNTNYFFILLDMNRKFSPLASFFFENENNSILSLFCLFLVLCSVTLQV